MFCPQCRTSLPDGARFCAACGAQVPVMPVAAPATVVTVQYCANCGAELGAGKRFCNRCGAPAAQPPTPGVAVGITPASAPGPLGNGAAAAWADGPFVAPPQAGAGTAGGVSGVFQGMSGLTIAVLAGFAVAAVGTFLSWVRAGGFSVNGWDGDVKFRISEWIDIGLPLDALLVVAGAALGAYLLLAPRLGRSAPRVPGGALALGVAVAVVGALQVWYILDEGAEMSNVGIGLWAVIAGGAVAAVCSYMEANGKTFGGRA